jgi:hypothetical protein
MRSSPLWEKAQELSDFKYPWEDLDPPRTRFQALHSPLYLYFRFQAEDPELHAMVVENEQMEITESDRVEFFFRKDAQMAPYYCLEMDYLGRVLENSAIYHRQMDYDWNWPNGLQVSAQTTGDGYLVGGRISKASLTGLGLLKENRIEAGLFRADYRKMGPDSTAKAHWISWVDPQVPSPDFHIPSAFGILQLKT